MRGRREEQAGAGLQILVGPGRAGGAGRGGDLQEAPPTFGPSGSWLPGVPGRMAGTVTTDMSTQSSHMVHSVLCTPYTRV